MNLASTLHVCYFVYIFTAKMSLVVTCTQTHKSENIISASFTPFTWQI